MGSQDFPALARLAAGAYLRSAGFVAEAGLGLTRQVLSGLGIELPGSGPAPEASAPAAPHAASLRDRGEELLRRSADVSENEDEHPAYARILDELAPDEARILRLMHAEGPQPAVDVRAGAVPLNATTELIAPGLTMIGAEAGCRRPERVPVYLNNLFRLGLVWFSRETLTEQARYQVLEAQPDVIAALRVRGRGRTVRRSIALTPFGADFCERVLPPMTGGFPTP